MSENIGVPREPTADECSALAPLGNGWFGIWYPQMGGYVGRAAVRPPQSGEPNDCFDVYVWHDGEFPFTGEGGRNPVVLHHCEVGQFFRFAEQVDTLTTR